MRTNKKILGIDEAGRGCVVGPMVVCGVLLDEKLIPKLKAEGVKDSKALSPLRRTDLARKIAQIAEGVFIEEIPPSEIQERNLNLLEIWRMARIISRAKPHRVYLDAPLASDRGIKAFSDHIKRCLRGSCPTIVAENHADATYTIVGAASIVAKVRRDEIIESLKQQFGDFGSGYPSDARTRQFLRNCYAKSARFPECVRQRWKTVRLIAQPVQATIPFPND
jgi:ribonuclease HII